LKKFKRRKKRMVRGRSCWGPCEKTVWAAEVGTAEIPALQRLRQEDPKFKVSLVYIVRPCLKKKQTNVKLKMDQRSKFKS
jgi:hypothetical protein